MMATAQHNGHIDMLKTSAAGRWHSIVSAVCGIDAELLDGRHHPCPQCGGKDRFRAFNDFVETGGVICNQCHSEKNGDGISTVQWALGCDFPVAVKKVAHHLGIENGQSKGNGRVDVVVDVAQRKRVPLEEWKAFGAHEAKRGKLTVCRLPIYGPDGNLCSHFDLATIDDKWLKGLAAKGKPTEVFLKGGQIPQPGDAVYIVEGPKDAAALSSLGYQTVGLSGKQLGESFAQLFRDCRVVVVPDRDEAGEKAVPKTAARLAGTARSVAIATLPGELKPKDGDGVREVLAQDDGETLLRQAFDQATPWSPDNAADSIDERMEILVTTDEYIVNAAAVEALAADVTIYQRGGRLVHVVHEAAAGDAIDRPEGTSRIADLPEAVLRDRLTAVASFVRVTQEDNAPTNPPNWCVKAVHARGNWSGIRPLAGITSCPILRSDGTILSTVGYDSKTGMLYQPTGPMPSIPDNPTKADAQAAVKLLFDVVAEFPFAKPEHKSAWLAGLLTPAAKHTFDGPAPLFLFDANAAGSGKGLLADATSLILTGNVMSAMSNPKNDDEARKRITSLVMQADPMILIDNIDGSLGCASLDAALTATRWKDRILGGNKMVDMSIQATWFGTGNNVVLKADTSRRVCHIRIDTKVENPEERDGFKYPDLRAHIRENRAELLRAVLTILRAWFVAGKPDAKLKAWGSYEGWSGVVRNAIVWLGLPDPGETRQELRERSDNSGETLRALIAGWEELCPDGGSATAAAAIKSVTDRPGGLPILNAALLEYCPGKDGKLPSAMSLGMKLKHLTGRITAGKHFDCREVNHMKSWFVRDVSAQEGTKGSGGTNSHPSYAGAHTRTHASDSVRVGTTPLSPLTPLDDVLAEPQHDKSGVEKIRHKDTACTSTDSWRHRSAGLHCSDCWPCTDDTMRVNEK